MKHLNLRARSIARSCFSVFAAGCILASLRLCAADYTWDASGGAPSDDGGGNWNAVGGTNWYDGSTYGAWGNTTADHALFGVGNGAAGTVTLGTVTANAITFNAPGSGNYTLSGGTITLDGISPTITANADAAIASALNGAAGLIKAGGGLLTLSGSNAHIGGITVSAGTLSGGTGVAFNGTQGGSFGTGPLTITNGATVQTTGVFTAGGGNNTTRVINVNGGTLNLQGASTGGEYIRQLNMTAGTVTFNSGTVYFRAPNGGLSLTTSAAADPSTITTGVDLTLGNLAADVADGAVATDLLVSGAITQNTGAGSGAKSVTKTGAGTLLLSGNNTFSGGLIVSAGTLMGGAGVAFNGTQGGSFGTGPLTINTGGTVLTTGAFVAGGGNSSTRVVNVDGGTLNLQGAGSGGEYIRTLNMTAGTVTFSSGTVYFRAPNGGLNLTASASANPSTITTGMDLTLGHLTADVADGAAATDLIISGAITQNTGAGSGAKSITKTGQGTLRLSGNNSYSGGTVVTGGTLSGSLGVSATGTQGGSFGSGSLTIQSGASVVTTGFFVAGGGNQTTRVISLEGGTLNIQAASTGGEYIRTLNMTGGTVTFNSGTVYFRAPMGGIDLTTMADPVSSVITTGIDLTQGGLLAHVAEGSAGIDLLITGNITENSGAGSGAKSLTKNGAGTLTLNGALSFAGNLDNQSGLVTLSNTGNSYTGYTHIRGGTTIRLDASGVVPNTSTVLMYGGTFNVNGQTETIGSLTTGSASDTAAAVTLGAGNLTVTSNSLPSGMTSGYSNATWHGTISGTGGITYNQSSGTGVDWTLATANSYSGGTSVLAGRIRAQNTGAFGSGAVTVGDGGAAYLVASGGTFGNNFNLTGRGPNESGTYYGALRVAGNEDVSGQITLNPSANPVNIRNDAGVDLGGGGLVLSGKVTGSGGLEKSGTGTLRLTNTTNDFSGNITIAGGHLQANDNLQFGNASNTIVFNGGTFQQYGGAALTIGSGHTLTATAGNAIRLHVWGGGSITVNGPITGASATGLIKTDSGTLILANSGNSYAGYTFIDNSSQIRLDADNVIPDTSSVLMYGGSTLNVNGRTETLAGVHVGSSGDTTATLQLGTGANLTVTGTSMPGGAPTNIGGDFYAKITGTGNITYNHSSNSQANWTWRNTANDFAGNITITSGRIQALEASLGNAGNDIIFNGDVVSTLNNGEGKASLQVTNGTSLTLNSGRTITLNSGKEGTMYVWGATTMQIDGQITGGGNLRKEDGGILLLTNTSNNYTGQTKLAYGELKLGAANVLPDATTVVVGNNGFLNLNGLNDTVSYIAGDGSTGGYISGNGGTLFVNGAGSSTYTGRITDTIGGGNNGAIVAYTGTGSLTLAGTQDNSGGRARVDSGTLVLGKASTGSVHAVGTTNATALFINGGTAQLGGTGDDQIYTQSNVAMTGGTFDLNGRAEGFRGLTGAAGTVLNNGGGTSVLILGESSALADTYTFDGTIANGSGVINLTKRGSGTQVLTGSNSFTGTVTVMEGGVISVPSVANTGVAQPLGAGATPVNLQAGSSLLFTGASGSTNRGLALSGVNGGILNIPTGTLTVSGSITGASANLTKSGAGTFNQSGSGDWTGDFFISGGTYNVTSGGSIGGVGVTELTGGATLNINSSTLVRTSGINLVNGTVNLNAGTLRTNGITMASGTAFNWSAGTLTMQTDAAGSSGSTDRRTPGSSLSAQAVYEGRIITIDGAAAAVTMPAGSVLDLGPTYGSNGMRYDQLSIAGALDLSSPNNTLHFEFNPFFFRPSTYGADAAGTLILVDSTGFTGTFESFTGVVSDYIGFSAAPGSGNVVGILGMSTLNPLTDIPANTYYLEYETDSGNILFHYRLTATIPEPASAGLMVAGLVLLRALRRRRA